MSNIYENPFSSRYASPEMMNIFSEQHRIGLWRRLWLALAGAEKELGLKISDTQLNEMASNLDNIDFALARQYEDKLKHDVMAHIHTFGDCCPNARSIIHLGATSCFVTDNSELIQMHEALDIIIGKIKSVLRNLCNFARKYKDIPCLGLTHGQAAQLTTVGKRATLYIQDLSLDLENLLSLKEKFKLRGAKGTTGTQASFLSLFDGDLIKVKKLDSLIAKKMGFERVFPITSQTYTRKFDYFILSALSGIAQSASKFATDMRLMQSRKEWEEPFGKNQVGSSAMAYKRNPMMSERICALSRYLISLPVNSAITASSQWFERTLDDSANRRIVNSQAFLAADSILIIMNKVTEGIVVYPKIIANYLEEELPFIASENLLMASVKNGADRQTSHEIIRKHSMDAALNVKENGGKNDFLERITRDEYFSKYIIDISEILNPSKYVGCAPSQAEEYVEYVETHFLG